MTVKQLSIKQLTAKLDRLKAKVDTRQAELTELKAAVKQTKEELAAAKQAEKEKKAAGAGQVKNGATTTK